MEQKEAAGEDPKTALREYQQQANKENGTKRKAENDLGGMSGKKGRTESEEAEEDDDDGAEGNGGDGDED